MHRAGGGTADSAGNGTGDRSEDDRRADGGISQQSRCSDGPYDGTGPDRRQGRTGPSSDDGPSQAGRTTNDGHVAADAERLGPTGTSRSCHDRHWDGRSRDTCQPSNPLCVAAAIAA